MSRQPIAGNVIGAVAPLAVSAILNAPEDHAPMETRRAFDALIGDFVKEKLWGERRQPGIIVAG
jgi:hypothetical protein